MQLCTSILAHPSVRPSARLSVYRSACICTFAIASSNSQLPFKVHDQFLKCTRKSQRKRLSAFHGYLFIFVTSVFRFYLFLFFFFLFILCVGLAAFSMKNTRFFSSSAHFDSFKKKKKRLSVSVTHIDIYARVANNFSFVHSFVRRSRSLLHILTGAGARILVILSITFGSFEHSLTHFVSLSSCMLLFCILAFGRSGRRHRHQQTVNRFEFTIWL